MTDSERKSHEDFQNRLTWEREEKVWVGYTNYAKQMISHYERWDDFKNVVAMKVEHMLWYDYVMYVYPEGKMIDYDLLPMLEPGPRLTVTLSHVDRNPYSLIMKIGIEPCGLAHAFEFTIEGISMAYGRRPISWIPEMVEKECERFIRFITIGCISEKYEGYVKAKGDKPRNKELPEKDPNLLTVSADLIFIGKQRTLWHLLHFRPRPTWIFAELMELPSKNISKQLQQMADRTGLVKFEVASNGHKNWFK